MTQDRLFNEGIFAGADMAVRKAFGLGETNHLRQRKTCRTVAGRPVPAGDLVDLVGRLYGIVRANLGDRPPSTENWRWKLQTYIGKGNKSPEVVLERAVAILTERGHLAEWCNQIPVASGLVDHKSDKRAAVDLARIGEDHLDLFELKWGGDTPIYAAFEILLYGLAYLLCRANKAKLGYDDLVTMKVKGLGLNVLAPSEYYESLDLTWLETGLDAGFRKVSQELFGPDFQASFRFLTLPIGPARPFATGAEAMATCGASPLAPSAMVLVQAISNLIPTFPLPRSA